MNKNLIISPLNNSKGKFGLTIENNKNMGLNGAVLTLTGIVGTIAALFTGNSVTAINIPLLIVVGITGLLGFIGFILFLISMYGFSKDYAQPQIFNYIIYAFVGTIIAAIVIFPIGFAFLFTNLFSTLSNSSSPTNSSEIQSLIASYLSPLIPIMTVVSLVWIYFNYKSYNLLAEKSGVPLFSIAAKIFVLGTIVNLAVGVVFTVLVYNGTFGYDTIKFATLPGGLIQYGAWAFIAKGFKAIKVSPQQTISPQTSPTIASAQYCPNCGSQTQPSDVYCIRCGKKTLNK